jgi:putative membrane protein
VPRERFPARVYRHGSEPDPRFSLANERTFLAWIRTSLALVAAGVAVEALQVPIRAELRVIASVMFVAMGLLAALQAWLGWMRTERALRENVPLPAPSIAVTVAGGLLLATAVVAVGLFL